MSNPATVAERFRWRPEDVEVDLSPAPVREHMGPGPHPDGSPQSVHGGKGGAKAAGPGGGHAMDPEDVAALARKAAQHPSAPRTIFENVNTQAVGALQEAILARQGFDGPPARVGDYPPGTLELYRGVQNSESGKTGEQMVDDFRDGKLYVGTGQYGPGVYVSPSRQTAQRYAWSGGDGAVIEMGLAPDSRILKLGSPEWNTAYKAASDAWRTNRGEWTRGMSEATAQRMESAFLNPATIASAAGYDALEPGSRFVEEYLVFNRTATMVRNR